MKHPAKLQKAINGLLIAHPFFASVLLRQKIRADDEAKTFWVDGETLGYSPTFLETLSHSQAMGVLAHEVLHLTSLHHARAHGRNADKWNQACDYAINPIVTQCGLELPKGALLNPAFAGKTAEEIYRLLPDNPNNGKDGKQQSQQGGFGEVRPSKDKPTQAEEKAKVQTKQATAQARQAGKLPAFLERAIAEIPASIDWRELLARFIAEQVQTESNWMRPNRRFAHAGLVMPAMHSLTIGNIVFVADTSASIKASDVSKVCSEMLNALQTFEALGKTAELLAIYCDAKIRGIQTLTPFDKPQPVGGGGTDFRPPFDYLEQAGINPIALVYLTDGECNSFPSEPAFPVLWVRVGNYKGFKPPFGEVINTDLQ